MGRWIDVDELVTAAGIADRLGASRASLVHDWRSRDLGFPEPVADLGSILLWSWPEVEAWAAATGHPRRSTARSTGKADSVGEASV